MHERHEGHKMNHRHILQASMPNIEASTTQTERQNIALLAAAENGDAIALATALTVGADIHAQDDDGWTSAIFAAAYGHHACLQTLITAGSYIHARDKKKRTDRNGWTAALLAAHLGLPATASLIENLSFARS